MQDPMGFQQMKAPAFPEQEQLKCPRCDSANTKFCYYNNYNLSQPRHFCKDCRRYWTKGGALRNIPVGGGTRKNTKRSSSSSSSNNSNHPKRQPNPVPEPTRNQKLPDPTPPPPTTSSMIPQQVLLSSRVTSDADQTRMYVSSLDQGRKMMDIGGSFSSLLASNGQFGNFLHRLNPNGSGSKTAQMDGFGGNLDPGRGMVPASDRDPGLGDSNNSNGDSYSGVQGGGGGDGGGDGDTSCWTGGSNGWPDLAIYTPGSSFH